MGGLWGDREPFVRELGGWGRSRWDVLGPGSSLSRGVSPPRLWSMCLWPHAGPSHLSLPWKPGHHHCPALAAAPGTWPAVPSLLQMSNQGQRNPGAARLLTLQTQIAYPKPCVWEGAGASLLLNGQKKGLHGSRGASAQWACNPVSF